MQVRLCERAAYTPPCLREEAGRWRVCTGTAVDLLKTAVRMFLRMVRGPLAATVIRYGGPPSGTRPRLVS